MSIRTAHVYLFGQFKKGLNSLRSTIMELNSFFHQSGNIFNSEGSNFLMED